MDNSVYQFGGVSISVGAANLLSNVQQTIVDVVNGTKEEEYKKFTNTVSHDQFTYQVSAVVGGGMGRIMDDGETPSYYTFSQGFTKIMQPLIFVARYRISDMASYFSGIENMSKSQAVEKLTPKAKTNITNLKNSITDLKNYLAQSVLAQAWAQTTFTFTPIASPTYALEGSNKIVPLIAWDGLSIWNSAHLYEDKVTTYPTIVYSDGGTSGTPNPSFSYSALIAARATAALRKDANNLPMRVNLNTLLCREGSQTYFLANSIKRTIDAGMYPSTSAIGVSTAGVTGSFVDRAGTDSFEIVTLQPYQGTGITASMWFLFDRNMLEEGKGFQFVTWRPFELLPAFKDYAGNLDAVVTALEYGNVAMADPRGWMASNGTNA